jgi:hypothetical protein
MIGGGECDRQTESSVVGLRVVVDVRRRETLRGHGGHVSECLLLSKASVNAADSRATGDVVHPQSGSERARDLARHQSVLGEDWKHERQQRHQVRCVSTKSLTFVERFVHQANLALLQIAQTTVHQLRALR